MKIAKQIKNLLEQREDYAMKYLSCESNYTGGYYGEVYQACSTYDYAEKKFLYKENEMKKKKENNRVTSGQVQVPQSPEMVLIKEDYHPIKFIIEEVKKRLL